ncbi:MAG: hypothetical protein KGP12_03755 [Actinomycetales bacterium]|nr:hypothetical protein [Actinomycetales bacterium]
MKALGWIALAIAVISVLIGVSPILLFSGSQDGGGDAGWVFLLFSVPVMLIGLIVAGVLALITSVKALNRGARLPGLLGMVGIVGSVVLGIIFVIGLSGSGEVVAAVVIGLAALAYLMGLVAAIWAGFAADPKPTTAAPDA